jgi:hypothetical protein
MAHISVSDGSKGNHRHNLVLANLMLFADEDDILDLMDQAGQ